MPTDDTITVNRVALVALVKAAKELMGIVLGEGYGISVVLDVRNALLPFADLQE